MHEMSRSRLRQSISNKYALFIDLLAEFNEEQMLQPGAVGKWSLKDTVAHIVIHEQRMIEWLTATLQREYPQMPEPYNMPDTELGMLNEEIYQQNLDRPLSDILKEFGKTHAEVLALVERISDEDLLDSSRLRLQGGEPLWEAIAANTFWHYEEHARDIRSWQAETRAGMMHRQTKAKERIKYA